MPSQKTDFVIITALPEERDAILSKLPGYRQLPPSEHDVRIYYMAEVPAIFSDGSYCNYSVIVLCLLNMGRIEGANATGDAIRRWNPRYVLMVGISGGVTGQGVELGDVLVSDQIVDYELQKLTVDGPKIRYSVHRADPRLLGAAMSISEDWRLWTQSKRPRKGQSTRHQGPIATGDKVIAVSDALEVLHQDWPKLIGVEMEAGGVASAAFQSASQPGFFMVRGVSDLADAEKDTSQVGKWRAYACDVAASFAFHLLKCAPVPPITLSPTLVGDGLQLLPTTLTDVVAEVTADAKIADRDLGLVLVFIEQVAEVVDDAFSQVAAMLTSVVTLDQADLQPERLRTLAKGLQQIQDRTYYRNAGAICERLRTLRETYDANIAPVISHLPGKDQWTSLFWLLEEREGQIVRMLGNMIGDIAAELYDFTGHSAFSPMAMAEPSQRHVSPGSASINSIRQLAFDNRQRIVAFLNDIRQTKNSILGLSGRTGFLELVKADLSNLDENGIQLASTENT